MTKSTRREFLQTSTALLAASLGTFSFSYEKKSPLLSFSTLGCPDWTFSQIVDFASTHHFNGIEVRGILKQLDLTLCSEFSKQNIASTLRLMEDKKLRFVDLGSSCTLHFPESAERRKNIDEGKRFIDLAQQIKCPFIRVFPNIFPKDQEKSAAMDLITKGMLELGDYAKGSNVSVLVESHGDLVFTADLEAIMKAAKHPHTGMVWDITNMWIKTKESPAMAYEKLKEYIRHTHIKNAKQTADGKIQYVRLGEGDVPVMEAVDALVKGSYDGYYCFEWEKLWHPEIEAPELAFADYEQVMREHFKL
jgi:sugar phosphate isomerase/epimerase